MSTSRVTVFIAGIIQGSHTDSSVHPQDYRKQLKAVLKKHCGDCTIVDPFETYPDSTSYDAETSVRTLFEILETATHSDLLVAYLPEASMGTALEMWECKRAGVPVVTITEMPANWVVQAASTIVLASLEEFESFAADGGLQELIRRRGTPTTSAGDTPIPGNIYEGDCLEIMRGWEENVFDACVTDPPYNMSKSKGLAWAFSSHVTMAESWDMFGPHEYERFTRTWIEQVRRVVKPNGNIFIFGSFHNIYLIGSILQDMDLKIVNSIVWYKPNAQPNITCRQFTESTEHIIWTCNNSPNRARKWTFNYDTMKDLNDGKQMRNVWEIPVTPPREKRHGKHPTQKAEQVLERIILAGTNPGDMILDCFSGTGSTAVVAEGIGRRWVLIENQRRFNQIAGKRLEELRKSRAQLTIR